MAQDMMAGGMPLRRVASVIAAVLLLATVSFTLAYLTSTSATVNEFTVADNEIEIREDFEQPDELAWDMDIPKVVTVENTGSCACYVRVAAEFTDPDAASLCDLDINTAAWTEKQVDGYYYLREPLEIGETSPALFTRVHVGSAPDVEGAGDWVSQPGAFDVIVVAESVMSEGSASPQEAFSAHTVSGEVA